MAIDTQDERMSIMGWHTYSLPIADFDMDQSDRMMFQGLPAVDVPPPIGTAGRMTEKLSFGSFGDFGMLP